MHVCRYERMGFLICPILCNLYYRVSYADWNFYVKYFDGKNVSLLEGAYFVSIYNVVTVSRKINCKSNEKTLKKAQYDSSFVIVSYCYNTSRKTNKNMFQKITFFTFKCLLI